MESFFSMLKYPDFYLVPLLGVVPISFVWVLTVIAIRNDLPEWLEAAKVYPRRKAKPGRKLDWLWTVEWAYWPTKRGSITCNVSVFENGIRVKGAMPWFCLPTMFLPWDAFLDAREVEGTERYKGREGTLRFRLWVLLARPKPLVRLELKGTPMILYFYPRHWREYAAPRWAEHKRRLSESRDCQ